MKSVTTCLAVSAVLACIPGCGAPPETTPPSSPNATSESALRDATDVHGSDDDALDGESKVRGHDDCLGRVDFPGVSAQVRAQLNIARRAVCRFRRLEQALDEGYVDTGLPCIPGQGYHFIKNKLVGTTDIRDPSVLMYDKDGNLNSPEWVAPLDGFPTPPTIFGEVMHADDDLGLWIQHVWVWKLNPNGVFEDVNPNVTCP